MTIPTTPSFSRSGRSGPGGKHTERISTDVSESLLCDIADAQELFREQSPTATRAEVVRMILEEDLHGCIGSLARTFPAASSMDLETATRTFAAVSGQTLEQFQDFVMAKFIFGRLRAVSDYSVAHMPNLGNAQNETEAGPVSEPKEVAQ